MQSLPRLQIGLSFLLAAFTSVPWCLYSDRTAATAQHIPPLARAPTNAGRSPDSEMRSAGLSPAAQDSLLSSALVFQHVVPHSELPIVRGPHWQTTQVRGGETLAAVFKREGISPIELARITHLQPYQRVLAKIHTGTTIDYQIDATRRITLMRYQQSRLQTLIFARSATDRFEVSAEIRHPETRLTSGHGTVERTLMASAKNAGLSTQMTIALAKVFQWDIDFALDIKPGDSFALVYETRYLDGERIGDGSIIAAEFVNRGIDLPDRA